MLSKGLGTVDGTVPSKAKLIHRKACVQDSYSKDISFIQGLGNHFDPSDITDHVSMYSTVFYIVYFRFTVPKGVNI